MSKRWKLIDTPRMNGKRRHKIIWKQKEKNIAVSFNKLKNLCLIVSIWMWMTWGELIQGTFIRI